MNGLKKLPNAFPKRCYSNCKGTITKLKSRTKYATRAQATFNICVMFVIASTIFHFFPHHPLLMSQPFKQKQLAFDRRWANDALNGRESFFDVVSYNRTNNGRFNYNNTKKVEFPQNMRYTSEKLNTGNPISDSEDNFRHWNPFAVKDLLESLKKAIILSLLAILFISVLHIRTTVKQQICLASPQSVTWSLILFRHLPLKAMSRMFGYLHRLQFPYLIRFPLLVLFVWVFKIKLHEAEDEHLENYTSILNIFTRKLRSGVRPVDIKHQLVSPADGTVVHVGRVEKNVIEQVKGVQYSLKTFVGRGVLPKYTSRNGEYTLYTAVVYLSPGDYHHFHSPADWKVNLCRHFPGELLSVSPWAVRCMPGLFALNERVLLSGKWEHGFFSLTAVGAAGVGSIQVDMYKELKTNVESHYKFNTYNDKHMKEEGERLAKGEHVGGFEFGSTVVLIFEAPKDFEFTVSPGDKLDYGQPLGTVVNF